MIDAFDDLGHAKKPYRVVAVIPVHERLELLPHTIRRLYWKNGVDKVICVGDGRKEKAICIESGAYWVAHQNKPLGLKWNVGFQAAKEFKPDAVLYVGSSDWVSDNWIEVMKPHVETHHMAGVPGCHFLDIGETLRLVNWVGYKGARSGETIGIGRMLSRELLDKINWTPFDSDKNSSLDRSMKDKARSVGVNEFHVMDARLKAVSISTNRWDNLHDFRMHWTGILPSEKIDDVQKFLINFPEANEIFK